MIVVKIGGGKGNSFSNIVDDIPRDEEVIIVHGGSDRMNDISERLCHPPKMLTSPSGHSSRFTDRETLDIIQMVYSGSVNKNLVTMLRRAGHNAVGLTGLDGGLITGRRKSAVRYVEGGKTRIMRGDNTGKVTSVNGSLLKDLLGSGYLPVVTIPIGDEKDHGPLNADCDRVAAAVAGTLKADKLVLLTNQPGLLKDPEDPGTLIRQIPAGSIDDHMKYAKGRMKRKMIGAKEAIDGGVSNVFISSSETRDPITTALEGGGTSIC